MIIQRDRAQGTSAITAGNAASARADTGHDAMLAAAPSALTPAVGTTSAGPGPQPLVCGLAHGETSLYTGCRVVPSACRRILVYSNQRSMPVSASARIPSQISIADG